ncbi:ribonuclease HII [Imtechella halotolerans]|uniref:Ribonuclease HII n=1 Tax=Imtechella halotolerans K1 TaxID=946077 RepID=I0WIH3_9FLAO|nr:ribonuclease HII [Imtechella halotolerans]EID76189.1 ribonuclease H [Imtechella halotolerans K1]WMQ63375.1 ribonuclease HII [Imtechella halotolerans]
MLLSYYHTYQEAGTDEAGRGCLAGPVTASAVILPPDFKHPLLNDSKQLSEAKRSLLRPIIEKEALSFSVCHILPEKIDEINILNASILAMHNSLKKLSFAPEFIIVDGNRFKPFSNIPHQCIVKGDSKYMSIAAASILAKTYRDEYMEKLHQDFPMYMWNKNKGYPTEEHRNAIKKHGISPQHRKSFRLLPEQLTLDF